MTKAIYPGTFDPPTNGHLNIIQRASLIFNPLIIAIGYNDQKPAPSFAIEERIGLLRQITSGISNVQIISFQGLLIDFAQSIEAQIIIRSLRNFSDFEFESDQAAINRQLSGIETMFFPADKETQMISSTLIRQLARNNSRLKLFIPEVIEDTVFKRLSAK